MTVYQPICTCAVEGIYGCQLHTFGGPTLEPMTYEPVEVVAEKIVAGGAFVDEDAVRVARAFLDERTNA